MKDKAQTPDFQFVSLVRETYWLLRSIIDARLEPQGLSHALWRPLLTLYAADGPMTQSQLARVLAVESPTLVRLLDRLTDKGWIVRRHCPGDRRAYHVELTPHALGLCEKLSREVAAIRHEALEMLRPAELDAAISILGRVRDRLQSMDGAPLPEPAATPVAKRATRARGVSRAARKRGAIE